MRGKRHLENLLKTESALAYLIFSQLAAGRLVSYSPLSIDGYNPMIIILGIRLFVSILSCRKSPRCVTGTGFITFPRSFNSLYRSEPDQINDEKQGDMII